MTCSIDHDAENAIPMSYALRAIAKSTSAKRIVKHSVWRAPSAERSTDSGQWKRQFRFNSFVPEGKGRFRGIEQTWQLRCECPLMTTKADKARPKYTARQPRFDYVDWAFSLRPCPARTVLQA